MDEYIRGCAKVFAELFTNASNLSNFKFKEEDFVGGYSPAVCIADLDKGKIAQKIVIEPKERDILSTEVVNVGNDKFIVFHTKPIPIPSTTKSVRKLIINLR